MAIRIFTYFKIIVQLIYYRKYERYQLRNKAGLEEIFQYVWEVQEMEERQNHSDC